jgi:hypothetical protein
MASCSLAGKFRVSGSLPGQINQLKLLIQWACRPRLLWLGVLLAAVTVLVIVTHREVCIRWWGTALQLFGVASVVHTLLGGFLAERAGFEPAEGY